MPDHERALIGRREIKTDNGKRNKVCFLVSCSCGYESKYFTSLRDAENDEYEHYSQAHP